MYYSYFGLKQPPFKITPDTRLFFPGGNRGATLEALTYAILNGEGIVKVVGEVGSGKTMLCRMLQVELPENVEIVYLANPSLSPENILHAIALELELPVKADDSRLQVMQALQSFLLAKHAENRRVVMFVEEAQGMPLETLEEIRLLSNLETQQDKLLQIVLFGQPELDEHLGEAHIRQLKERITYSFHLPPLKVPEIRDYLNARLRASGHRGSEVFSRGAIRAIARCSEGLLRRINILADKAMLAAYADSATRVIPRHVARAARDSEFEPRRGRRLRIALSLAAGLVLLAAAVLFAARSGAFERLRALLAAPPHPSAAAVAAPPAKAAPNAPLKRQGQTVHAVPADTAQHQAETAKPATGSRQTEKAAPVVATAEAARTPAPSAPRAVAEAPPSGMGADAAPPPQRDSAAAEVPGADVSAQLLTGAEMTPIAKPMLAVDGVGGLVGMKN